MFRLTSWISESRVNDKPAEGDASHTMIHDAAPNIAELPSNPNTKRKLDEAINMLEIDTQQDMKRAKTNSWADSAIDVESDTEVVEKKVEATVDALPHRVRDIFESTLSLGILEKHDELRQINQELAKCQVALEQLRRVHLIPYPVSQHAPKSMLDVTNGTGPALRDDNPVPHWAPSFGVADGPYSRHYAKWLIPDPSFDGQEWTPSSRASNNIPEGRSTRHGIVETINPVNKPRSGRNSAGQKLQALSSGYAQPKEKVGPCVLKRNEDNQWVKLVCLDCKRENFSSTQGFINHCRIAHRREFRSHEEAALASGQIIEADEVNSGVVGVEKVSAVATGLVNPLIRSAPISREAYLSLQSHIADAMRLFEQGRLPGVTSVPTSTQSSSATTPVPSNTFISSPDTPHLSKLLQSRGFGGNLTDIVSEAKQPIDLDELLSYDEESEDERKTPEVSVPAMRVPARAVICDSVRPNSSKGVSPRMSFSPSDIDTIAANHPLMSPNSEEVDMMGPSLLDLNLSPNTIASNNAPSLVSDDGDYDEVDDAESASESDEGSDVAEIDIEDGEARVVEPIRNTRKEKESKHVTFVSPVKDERHVRP
ncbi:hypothetical protein BJ878DRAFT_83515 [Calycina marina]|uniref:AHC1-like C2H2 zinc-finger domain-containing protein n=1 Tax=Calycina marina TaxID=1763456 RepID=A0A9P7ZA89_9HELO|nr:hypothetical protein BJ878DRAFT_83515 [Calycina marina]